MAKGKVISRTSPWLIEDMDDAFATYCAMPFFKRDNAPKKPTRKAFEKLYATKREAKLAESTPEAAPAMDLQAIIAAAVAKAVADATGTTPDTDSGDDDLTMDERKEDSARNAVLWRLNVEGLLGIAYDRAAEAGLDYITQELGTTLLTETFGPLAK